MAKLFLTTLLGGLFFLAGCNAEVFKTGTLGGPRVVTVEDDNKFVCSAVQDEWVRVRLRVYPPHRWKFCGVTKVSGISYDKSCQATVVRVKGDVPGDPEHDVFHVNIPGKSGGREVVFTLLNEGTYSDMVRPP